MFEISFDVLLLVSVIIFTGSLIQGVIGYGVGMFSAPLLFLIDPSFVPAPLILISTLLTLIMLHRDKRDLSVGQVSWTMVGGLVGTIGAGFVLAITSGAQFQFVFGLLIVFAVLISIAGYTPKITAFTSTFAGAFSGFMGTITAVGGPPVALLYQNLPASILKANLSAFFLFLNVIALAALYVVDKLDMASFGLFIMCIPSVLLGFTVSGMLARRIHAKQLKALILLLSAIAGSFSMIKAIIA